ncbi:hypothetical protein FA15DRAFT_221155 [Coprinopsis marcescibilis]|uniref:Uncharacterized protein n=1 Tax=Coprinopsis marcescibilis TaxID=230819 RepID=A0A5C3KTN0_COPMA|nr:hypothetical protein FA15DRAFT_221155 [Coprinopsis marcescibilis]
MNFDDSKPIIFDDWVFPNLTQTWDGINQTELKSYKKAFCANPPDNPATEGFKVDCPFGPCPNPDVTGIGSQVSIYVTTIVYALAVLYMPHMGRPMTYAHLSVIYSLMIAALVCVLKTDLTNSDGVFVLVCVASPSSIYLWFLSVASIWKPELFPVEKENKKKSKEVHALRVASLASLGFFIALVCVMFVPSEKIKFAQEDCTKEFGTSVWFNIVWVLPIAVQSLGNVFFFFLAMFLCWLWTRRSSYEIPPPSKLTKSDDIEEKIYTRTHRVDLITWTERILSDQLPDFMSPTLARCIATVLQMLVLPSLNTIAPTLENMVAFVILAFGCFKEGARPGASPAKVYTLRVLFLLLVVATGVAHWFISVTPSIPDIVLFVFTCTVAAWCGRNFTYRNMKVVLPILFIVLYASSVVVNVFMFFMGSPDAFATNSSEPEPLPEDASPDDKEEAEFVQELAYFMVSMATTSIWFILWSATSFWSSNVRLSLSEFIDGIFARGHLLKFFAGIALPHILWIQAADGSNPEYAEEADMNFGQIFSLIVSAVTVLTLLDEAITVKRPIWAAVFLSRKVPETNSIEDMMSGQGGRYGFGAEASIAPRSRPAAVPEKSSALEYNV